MQIEVALHFRALKMKIKKPPRKDRSTLAPWISDTTWKIAYQKTALGRKSRTNQGEHMVLTRRFQAALKEDKRSRVRRVGEEIEALVSNDQVREAQSKNQQWYREAKGNQVLLQVSSWIKPQPCRKTSTYTFLWRAKVFQY